jgi:hypothetical protein
MVLFMDQIVPQEFEINIIGGIVDQLETASLPRILSEAVADLINKTRFATDNPDKLVRDATEVGVRFLDGVVMLLELYIGSRNNAFDASRADLFAECLPTKQKYQKETGQNYDALENTDRALVHLDICEKKVEELVAHFVKAEIGADTGQENPQGGGVYIPASDHPPFVGLVHAFHVYMVASIECRELLKGKNPVEAYAIRAKVYDYAVKGLTGDSDDEPEDAVSKEETGQRANPEQPATVKVIPPLAAHKLH